ncbi:MAG: NUDIX domain-containing protein [Chloroflexi bacterium]|nr:NUDIX domain-containing protein [Chloroflexota bacterium]
MPSLDQALTSLVPLDDAERTDLARVRALLASSDPWTRASVLHVTGSALVFHPPSDRVLLRWHERQQNWLQVGGHADPGETDPLTIALREAGEETGLPDLVPWPEAAQPRPIQLVIVPVPPGKGEPAHEHADLRYVLATRRPNEVTPESPSARLRWLSLDEALDFVREDNLRECLARLAELRQTS